jgi:D-glycero-beta-D-manno-heptose 1-phosphate adenylyltransferase
MDYTQLIQNKILDAASLQRFLTLYRLQSKKIVFTNGCFDILHKGHADYLAKAKSHGDVLVIGLNADVSVTKLKGKNRPVNLQDARAFLMASLHVVDVVVLFEEETPYNLIKKVNPDVLVKGADYRPEDIVGYDIVKANGGTIVAVEFLQGYSTTSIINKLTGK